MSDECSALLNVWPGIALHGASRGVPIMGPWPDMDAPGEMPSTVVLRARGKGSPARKCPSLGSALTGVLVPPSPKPRPVGNPGVVGRAEGGGAKDDACKKKIVSCVACVTRCAVARSLGGIE